MPRKAKKELTPEEKKKLIADNLEQLQKQKDELPIELRELIAELEQIKPLDVPHLKELVQEELDDIRDEILQVDENIELLQEELNKL